MESWFNKRKAPDGTNIIRHENVETRLGVTKETAEYAQAREAVYERLFRKAAQRFSRIVATCSSHRRVHLQAISGK